MTAWSGKQENPGFSKAIQTHVKPGASTYTVGNCHFIDDHCRSRSYAHIYFTLYCKHFLLETIGAITQATSFADQRLAACATIPGIEDRQLAQTCQCGR